MFTDVQPPVVRRNRAPRVTKSKAEQIIAVQSNTATASDSDYNDALADRGSSLLLRLAYTMSLPAYYLQSKLSVELNLRKEKKTLAIVCGL